MSEEALFGKPVKVLENIEEVQERVNEWAWKQLFKIDPVLAEDVDKAEQFKKDSGYDESAAPGNKKNAHIKAQYELMIRQACERFDKRLEGAEKLNKLNSSIKIKGKQK